MSKRLTAEQAVSVVRAFVQLQHPGKVEGQDYRVPPAQRFREWRRFLKPICHFVALSVVKDAEGEPKYFISIGRDVTDRKRVEEERLGLERQVQHAQKLESLGVLAGGIAHDFNNLLMAILGNADLALDELSPHSPARGNIKEIEKASKRAAELAKQWTKDFAAAGDVKVKAMKHMPLVVVTFGSGKVPEKVVQSIRAHPQVFQLQWDIMATTMALGEEGNRPPGITTKAIGEEGGGRPRPTTLAVGEECMKG